MPVLRRLLVIAITATTLSNLTACPPRNYDGDDIERTAVGSYTWVHSVALDPEVEDCLDVDVASGGRETGRWDTDRIVFAALETALLYWSAHAVSDATIGALRGREDWSDVVGTYARWSSEPTRTEMDPKYYYEPGVTIRGHVRVAYKAFEAWLHANQPPKPRRPSEAFAVRTLTAATAAVADDGRFITDLAGDTRHAEAERALHAALQANGAVTSAAGTAIDETRARFGQDLASAALVPLLPAEMIVLFAVDRWDDPVSHSVSARVVRTTTGETIAEGSEEAFLDESEAIDTEADAIGAAAAAVVARLWPLILEYWEYDCARGRQYRVAVDTAGDAEVNATVWSALVSLTQALEVYMLDSTGVEFLVWTSPSLETSRKLGDLLRSAVELRMSSDPVSVATDYAGACTLLATAGRE